MKKQMNSEMLTGGDKISQKELDFLNGYAYDFYDMNNFMCFEDYYNDLVCDSFDGHTFSEELIKVFAKEVWLVRSKEGN